MHELHDLRGWSFLRPWPSAILAQSPDAKRCENRSRPVPRAMLGRYFAIHASQRYLVGDWPWPGGIAVPAQDDCPIGIVGVARIVGWLDTRSQVGAIGNYVIAPGETSHARLVSLDRDPWWAGPVGVLLDDVTPIDPVPCKGALGFWRVPLELVPIIAQRWEEARRAA
jgi:hypothetical protein